MKMILSKLFHRTLSHRTFYHSCAKSFTNILLQNKSQKELRLLHISASKCKAKNKEEHKLQKQLEGKNKVQVEVWNEMTVKEISSQMNCDMDSLRILVPNKKSNDVLDITEVLAVGRALHKKCVIIKNPAVTREKAKTNIVKRQPPSKPENLVKRPPIVTVMGHVDHGKTTLLDALRNTFVVDSEFGGITQHIGAFSVQMKSGQKITFIDTPGHAAFTTMRARGANVTDIVVLVIAADDGIMEQTIESIKIANRAGVKLIVAVNKIDKPNVLSMDEIKEKLLCEGIQVEDKGGNVQIVPISALKKINLDLLTDMILAEAEIMNLKGDPTGLVEGVIIESKIESQGAQATMIVKRGTLKKGKILVAGKAHARVRIMLDENSKPFTEVLPSTPVQIFGWKELPEAGEEVLEVGSENEASRIVRLRHQETMLLKQLEDKAIIDEKSKAHQVEHLQHRHLINSMSLQERKQYFKALKEKSQTSTVETESEPTLNIIVKGDVHGSLEVLLEILNLYDKHDECKLSIVDASVGNITPADVNLSEVTDAIIYAFNVGVHASAKELLKNSKVVVRTHNIIYRMMDDLRNELSSRLPLKDTEKIIGEADVNQNFSISKGKKKIQVAGCKCVKGELRRNSLYKVTRGDQVIYTGKLQSMRHHKTEVSTVRKNVECGLMLESFPEEFKPLDRIICYEIEKVQQSTSWDPGFKTEDSV